MARERKSDLRLQIERLEQRHGELSSRVAELDRRRMFLTHSEEVLIASLKREKLAAKDALVDLRRSN